MSTERQLNKWFESNYEWLLKEVKTNICKGRMSEYANDLVNHVFIEVSSSKNMDKIQGLLDNGKMKWYLLRACALQIKSSTSTFYRVFRKHKLGARSGIIDSNAGNIYDTGFEMNVELQESETLHDCFERAQAELDWYLKALWNKKFKEGWSLQEMYTYYGVSKRHIIKDLNIAINEIREKCEHAQIK